MKVSDFLRKSNLSIGDNFRLLLEKLNVSSKEYIKKIELRLGEPTKMSKSKGNTVDPEEAIKKYGADTVRLYILFASPVEKDFEWTEEGVQGAYRFLRRFWNYFHQNMDSIKNVSISRRELKDLQKDARHVRQKTHETLKRYLRSMQDLSFNTSIASIMELLNTLQEFKPKEGKDYQVLREAIETIVFMLYPITPHLCEELWSSLGYTESIVFYTFPEPDEEALKIEQIEIPIQINGRYRATVNLPMDADEELAKEIALKNERIKQLVNGREIKKVIYIKNRLLNLVV
ncbi:MAG: class I tRNA ligase family protein [Aquificaceae bacterium]